MTDRHILAIHTYGAQRVKDPTTHEVISAYKIGYTSAACDVLLALYGAKARNVSSPQASYRYVQIDGETSVRHGYLLLDVTPQELAQAESVARRFHRAAVYLWQADSWRELPNGRCPTYSDPGRAGPGFNPAGLRAVIPVTGAKAAAVDGIRVETVQHSTDTTPWHWLLGDTYPVRETLKRHGARFSSKRRAWYYIGRELPEPIRALIADSTPEPQMSPELVALIEDALAADDAAAIPPAEDATPDRIQAAIEQVKSWPAPLIPVTSTSQKRELTTITQEFVGELTGSISGNVWCYGYAIHEGVCVYLSMGGPRMAAEAIRAKLSKGETVNCVPFDAPAVELTAGEGNSGMYAAFTQNIPEARFMTLILCHDLLVNPNYGGQSTTFIFRSDDAQAAAHLKHHVTELVNVPVFDAWSDYLYHAGQAAMLVRPTRAAGGIDLLTVTLDRDDWTRLITGGLNQGVITLPEST